MLIRVDPSLSVPLFEQLADSVRAQIVTGAIGKGEKLPAAKALAESLEMNVHTVLHAYQMLRDEGIIDLHRGRGAVVRVSHGDYDALAESVARLVAEAKALGAPQAILTAMIREEYLR